MNIDKMLKHKHKTYICYLIASTTARRTYVGITLNAKRRIRQHNGEIAGGAKATRGNKWVLIAYAYGFKTKNEALSFEWWIHHKKKRHLYIGSVEKRLHCFDCVRAFSKFHHIQMHIVQNSTQK